MPALHRMVQLLVSALSCGLVVLWSGEGMVQAFSLAIIQASVSCNLWGIVQRGRHKAHGTAWAGKAG